MTENGPKVIRLRSSDIKSGKKNVLYVSRDITERKDFEQALVASEKKYRYLAENMRDAVWIMDLNWKHIYCSPAIQKIRGFTPEEVTELSIEKQMTPESLANALKLKEYGLTTGGLNPDGTPLRVSFEQEEYCKDGSTVFTDVYASMMFDEK